MKRMLCSFSKLALAGSQAAKTLCTVGRKHKKHAPRFAANVPQPIYSPKKEVKKPNMPWTRSDTLAMPETTEANANNSVLVGKKPIMNYVLACITLFHSGQKQVNIKARGKAISRAIDVAEVVRRKFLPEVKVKKVTIGTDKLLPQDEKTDVAEPGSVDATNVSTIEITLER